MSSNSFTQKERAKKLGGRSFFEVKTESACDLPTAGAYQSRLTSQSVWREVGVPGGGGFARARDIALFYQELLHNPNGIWDADILADVESPLHSVRHTGFTKRVEE